MLFMDTINDHTCKPANEDIHIVNESLIHPPSVVQNEVNDSTIDPTLFVQNNQDMFEVNDSPIDHSSHVFENEDTLEANDSTFDPPPVVENDQDTFEVNDSPIDHSSHVFENEDTLEANDSTIDPPPNVVENEDTLEVNDSTIDPTPFIVENDEDTLEVNDSTFDHSPSIFENEDTCRVNDSTIGLPPPAAKNDQDKFEVNDSPIEEVRLTVPITDDPTLPVVTFRTWVLGPLFCAILAFISQILRYHKNPIYIPSVVLWILLGLIGKLMDKTLSSRPIRFKKWSFSMNPGPFNIKEHVLVSVMASTGLRIPNALNVLTLLKILFKKKPNFWAIFLAVQSSQLLGYGFAGLFIKLLVDSPYMWYPLTLFDVVFFRTLHEEETRSRKRLTRFQFFIIGIISSFAYAAIPGFIFPFLGSISLVCLIWKKSIIAQIIGSGSKGLGIGAFSFHWWGITEAQGSPFAIPYSTIINIMVGFILFLYIITPIAYWTNLYDARRFPFYGSEYDDSSFWRIINQHDDLNFSDENYPRIYMSIMLLFSIGFSLACIIASLSHFLIFNFRGIIKWLKESYDFGEDDDVHNRLMKKYKSIPKWWFLVIMISMVVLAIISCEGFGKQLQLPYWGVLLACLLVLICLLPIGMLQATEGQILKLNNVSRILFGYIYPSRPLVNFLFETYTTSTLSQSLKILSQLKLGHYMKIPPKTMFMAQFIGTIISSFIGYVTTWWLLSSIQNICEVPKGSPWTCPDEEKHFLDNLFWGVIGPKNVFFPKSHYSKFFYFFIIGGITAPIFVWIFSKIFPQKKWIASINIPIILSAGSSVPSVGAVNFWSWFAVGVFFNSYVFKRYKRWWAKYNYLLGYCLDLGTAILFIMTTLTLNFNDIDGVQWWEGADPDDQCPLAKKPYN